jgi:hypothetical protein
MLIVAQQNSLSFLANSLARAGLARVCQRGYPGFICRVYPALAFDPPPTINPQDLSFDRRQPAGVAAMMEA